MDSGLTGVAVEDLHAISPCLKASVVTVCCHRRFEPANQQILRWTPRLNLMVSLVLTGSLELGSVADDSCIRSIPF